MQQQVTTESVRVQQVEKEGQVKVQDAEIARREKELIATVLKGAEIERQRIETLAAAEKQRLIAEAEGHASAIRAQGEAEAEIIFKKGESEAKAMNVKAEAYQQYNQAAVVDKLISNMPDVVKALASPLANVDRITVVSCGRRVNSGQSLLQRRAVLPRPVSGRGGKHWTGVIVPGAPRAARADDGQPRARAPILRNPST